jgi:arsenite methyltransferase
MSAPASVALYDELPLWSAPFGARLLNSVRLRSGIRVLDVGSGSGFPLLEIAQRLGTASEAYGCDPWKEGASYIAWKSRQREQKNVFTTCSRAEQLPFPNESFDLIVSNNGLNNVADCQAALAECHRVARHGAQLVLTQNLPGTMAEFYAIFKSCLSDLGLGESVPAVDAHILKKRLPKNELAKLLVGAGFSIEETTEDSFFLRFLDGNAFFDHWLIRKGFLPAWMELVPLPNRDAVFSELKWRLDTIALSEGELKLAVPFVCMSLRK